MRKLIAIILSLFMFCSHLCCAEQMIYGNGDTAESLVTYHVDSTFCILIPETLEVGTYPYYFSADSLDLCDNERIGISVYGISENGYITMHTNGGKQMVAEVVWTKGNVPVYEGQNIAVFTPTVSYSEDGIYINPVQHEGAGDYYGYITFKIQLMHDMDLLGG